MDKCEGCPIYIGCSSPPYIRDDVWCADDCHLTPSDMDAIRKAIAGEGRLFLVELVKPGEKEYTFTHFSPD